MLKHRLWTDKANKLSPTIQPIKAKPYNPNTLDNILKKLYRLKNNL